MSFLKELLSKYDKKVYLTVGFIIGLLILLLVIAPKVILGLIALLGFGAKTQKEQMIDLFKEKQEFSKEVKELEESSEKKVESARSKKESEIKDWLDGDF